jgi:hypothetical protein
MGLGHKLVTGRKPQRRPLFVATGFYDHADFVSVAEQKAINSLRFRFARLILGN